MMTTLAIAASGLRHQQQHLLAAAHNTANAGATSPAGTVTQRAHAITAASGGVDSRVVALPPPVDPSAPAPSGDLLSTGILPMLTAPNHARGLVHAIRAQDDMTGVLLDLTA